MLGPSSLSLAVVSVATDRRCCETEVVQLCFFLSGSFILGLWTVMIDEMGDLDGDDPSALKTKERCGCQERCTWIVNASFWIEVVYIPMGEGHGDDE